MTESDIKGEIILALQKNFTNGRFFVRPILKTKIDGKRFISSGVKGQADIYGFVSFPVPINEELDTIYIPIHVEIEVKKPGEKLKPAQIKWKKICDLLEVPHIVAHSSEEAVDELRRIEYKYK